MPRLRQHDDETRLKCYLRTFKIDPICCVEKYTILDVQFIVIAHYNTCNVKLHH